MTKEQLFAFFGDIDENYIREAQRFRAGQPAPAAVRPKVRKRLAALIAACCCLALLSAAALAYGTFGTQLISAFTSRAEPGSDLVESGYDLSVFIEKVPVKALGDVREAGRSIARQYEEYSPFSSWHPGHWQKAFLSREAACAYIGFAGLQPGFPDIPEKRTSLSVYGNKNGDIELLNLETLYVEGDIRLQYFSSIYTENFAGEITTGSRTTESIAFEEVRYTASGGGTCHILRSSPMESGFAGLEGYMVVGGVLHHLHIAFLEKDAPRAEELLRAWADAF